MPSWLKGAVPHQGLHNPDYYLWLDGRINTDVISNHDDLIATLKLIRTQLQGAP
jgi:hypothetical protein